MTGPTVALTVSGHGYGHSVRCAEVARALLARSARVLVRTEAPGWLLPDGVELIASDSPLDVGVVQHDGLELDIDATREHWTHFAAEFESRADAEARLLREQRVDMLVGDIPPLAFAAAARAGVPGLALGNFAWDWIYSAWPGFDDIVGCIRGAYSQADGLLRLPLHPSSDDAFASFRKIEDVPLIARRARRSRSDVRADFGISDTECLVLLSFGGFTAHGLDLEALAEWPRYRFLATPPLASGVTSAPPNLTTLNETPRDYVSLLAACDAVVTKPGYGIVADCLANHVSVLFTDRGPFREYDVLAEALPRLGRARYIPRQDLLAGALGPHLEALFASRNAWTEEAINGAEVVAERVLTVTNVQKR